MDNLCLPVKEVVQRFRCLFNDESREKRETGVILNSLVCLYVRFRSLLKSRCTTSDSGAFGDAYLNRSRSRRRKLVLFGGIDRDCRVADIGDQVYNSTRLINHPLEGAMNIVCSCNGLLLVHNPDVTMLWNPFTRKSKSVGCGAPGITLGIGLGYDYASNDHKFVRIATHEYKVLKELLIMTAQGYDLLLPDQHYKLDYDLIEVSVFDTCGGGGVVQIPFQGASANANARIDLLTTVGVFVKGALHWIWRTTDHTTEVLSLDISKQEFVKIYPPIPSRPNSTTCHHLSLHALGGEQQLLLGERGRESVELYEAHRDDTEGWRKLFKINLMELNGIIGLDESKHVKFLDYSTDGNRVLFQYPANANGYPISGFGRGKEEPTPGDLFWYDLERGRITFAYNPGMDFVYNAAFCWECLDSIPLLDDEPKQKEDEEPKQKEDENHQLKSSFVLVSFLSSQSIFFDSYKYVLPKSQVYS